MAEAIYRSERHSDVDKKHHPIKAFYGGELFNTRDLVGNLFLLDALRRLSGGKYDFYVAQEQCDQNVTHKIIKDKDTVGLVESEVALFAFEGVELDSGTVVEFMQAKTLDIPAVVYRSDIRGGSGEEAIDDRRNRWNLMCSFYPRVRTVYLSAIVDYQEVYRQANGDNVPANTVAQAYSEYIARILLEAMDEVMASPPILNQESKETLKRQCLELWGVDTPKENVGTVPL